MKPLVLRLAMAAVVATSASCGGTSSVAPSDPNTIPPAGSAAVTQVIVDCPESGESNRCTAFAVAGNDGRDVTGLATWSTSNTAIATVSSTGVVTAGATGEVAVRAAYRGVTGFLNVFVRPGQGTYGTYRQLQGVVLSLNGPLPDVLMQILTGPNAGRNTVTFSNGAFIMENLADSQFVIRLSKAGYITAEYNWSIPGSKDRIPTLTQAPK